MNNAEHTYTLPTGVTTITISMLDEIRYLKHITHVIIPQGVTSIEEKAFQDCKHITSITIPKSVVEIGDWAFYRCSSLTSITIPYGVTQIRLGVFSGCSSLASLAIPNSVKDICWHAFKDCSSLTTINIPDSVTDIHHRAFNRCKNLSSITIPNSVSYIGGNTFADCSSLTSITIGDTDTITHISKNAFSGCSSLLFICVPILTKRLNENFCTFIGINIEKTTLINQNQLSTWASNKKFSNIYSYRELAVLYQLQKDDNFTPSWPELGKLAPNLLMGDLLKVLPEKKISMVLPKIYKHRPITQCLDKLSLFSVTPAEARQEESDYLKKEGFQEYKNSNEPNKTVQLGEVDPAASSAIVKSLTLKEVATLLSLKASSELRPTDVSKDDHLTANKTKAVMQG